MERHLLVCFFELVLLYNHVENKPITAWWFQPNPALKQSHTLADMSISEELLADIQTLAISASKLVDLGFPRQKANRLRDLAAVVTYRRLLGPERAPLIGFIGCTGVGKSTLFNSLCDGHLSTTGWLVHNTRGPVLFCQADTLEVLEKWENQHGRLFMPSMGRTFIFSRTETDTTVGAPDTVHIFRSTEADGGPTTYNLMDLPDINSIPAIDEQLIAMDALPWLDIVVFMVDDETVYHRVYDHPVKAAAESGQTRLCVMVHRGHDRIDPQHPDWRKAIEFFGVDEIFVLPDLEQKTGYKQEPAYIALQNTLAAAPLTAHNRSMVKSIAALAAEICRENHNRRQQVDDLIHTIDRSIRDLLVRYTPLALDRILPDDTLNTLNHLGLKRFSLSNVLYFFKKTALSGRVKRYLRLSFGNHRDQVLTRLLHIDRQKLAHELETRVHDFGQQLISTVHRTPQFEFFKNMAGDSDGSMPDITNLLTTPNTISSNADELETMAGAFEKDCRRLLSSDSIARVIENDPLASFFLAVALATDVFVLPGFGSWLLFPTVLKYLPVGKFEKVKKEFQDAVQRLIRKKLLSMAGHFYELRRQTVLDDDDPLWRALDHCRAKENA
jgi:hypothetical protein